jgi:hypothetical protein
MAALSEHLNSDLTAGQILARILFSLIVTAAAGGGAYAVISWLAHLK